MSHFWWENTSGIVNGEHRAPGGPPSVPGGNRAPQGAPSAPGGTQRPGGTQERGALHILYECHILLLNFAGPLLLPRKTIQSYAPEEHDRIKNCESLFFSEISLCLILIPWSYGEQNCKNFLKQCLLSLSIPKGMLVWHNISVLCNVCVLLLSVCIILHFHLEK